MNEELLRQIWKDNFSNVGTFDQFKSDFQDPATRKGVWQDNFANLGSFEEFETDLGFKQPKNTNQPEPEDHSLYNFLGKVPVIGGAIQKAADAWSRGISKGAATKEGIDAMFGDLQEGEAEAIVEIMNKSAREVKGDKSITKRFTDEEGYSPGSVVGAFAEGIVESAAMMGRSLWDAFTDWKTAAYVSGRVAAGAAAFGARGAAASAVTGPGAAVGTGIGAFMGGVSSGLGSVSGLLEASQLYYEEMRRELERRELPLTKANILTINSDDDWLSATRNKAATKGLIVDAFDTLSGLVGAKMGASAIQALSKKATFGQTIVAGGKGALLDSGAGYIGEYVSSQAIREPASAKELLLEANPFGPGTITSTYSFVKNNAKILAAKVNRTEADRIGDPITPEDKVESEKPLGPSALVQALEEKDPTLLRQAIANLATVYDQEEFDAAISDIAKKDGLSAEEISSLTTQFVEAKKIATSFNTEELSKDPERVSRATAKEMDVSELKTQLLELEQLRSSSHPSLHEEYDVKINKLNEDISKGEGNIKAIVTRKETPVVAIPKVSELVGSTVTYGGTIFGELSEEDGVYYVGSTPIESGANPDLNIKDLDIKVVRSAEQNAERNKPNEIVTDFANNKITVNGDTYTYLNSNEASVTLENANGKKRTFRKADDVLKILTDKVKYESEQGGRSTADIIGDLENTAEQEVVPQRRPSKRVGRGVSDEVRAAESNSNLRSLSKKKFAQLDSDKKSLAEAEQELSDYGLLLEYDVLSNKGYINDSGGYFSEFDNNKGLSELKSPVDFRANAAIIGGNKEIKGVLNHRIPAKVLKSLGSGNVSKGKELITYLRRLNQRRNVLLKELTPTNITDRKLEASGLEGQALQNERTAAENSLRERLEAQKAEEVKRATTLDISKFTKPKEISSSELKKAGATSKEMISAKAVNKEMLSKFNEFTELLKKIKDCK